MPVEHHVEDGLFLRRSAARSAAPEARVLWIHGLGESGLCFERIAGVRALDRYEHFIPDLPGYGRSARAPSPISLGGCAERLARWMEGQVPGPVVAVGHSMGAIVALLLAERRPRLVLSLVDVDGNKSEADCAFSGPASRASPEAFAAAGLDDLRRRVGALAEGDEALAGYVSSLRLADAAQFHLHARELVDLSRGERLAARLGALACPRLFIAGVPRGVSPRSLELLREAGVTVAPVEPSGHWPFIDQPDEFAERLARFIRGPE